MPVRVRPSAIVERLQAYDPGHDLPALRRRFGAVIAELGSNENPFGPSPRVMETLRRASADEILRYPDPLGLRLRRALAARYSVSFDEIVLGNGSHELLMLLAQCFAGPGDEVVFSEFGFAVFPIATAAVGATPRRAPARAPKDAMPRGHDLDAMAAQIGPATRLVYLANPNNPTGTWFSERALQRFLAKVPPEVPVVVDEAYHEYVTDPVVGSTLGLRAEYPNLIVTRTFSKAYGLAGLRIGYVIADRVVIEFLNRLRESFNVNALALLAAERALDDPEHVANVVLRTAAMREAMATVIAALGVSVAPSQTNFVLADFGRDAAPIESRLLDRGVVTRPMGGYGLPTCLRINVGREDENARFLHALKWGLA